MPATHQLSGASDSGASLEDFPQVTSGGISVATAGQLYSSGIHQQPRGNCVTNPHIPGEVSVALERDIMITAQHIPGVSNGIADSESRQETDRSNWTLSYEVFQKIIQTLGPLEVDLFCFQTDPPATTILQLATRSPSRGSGCIPTGLEQSEGICQSSVVPNRACFQQDTITGSSRNPGGSSVEESGLISSNSGNAGGLSTAHSPTRPVAERPEAESNR